jgi:hypothetical protein
MPNKTSDKLGKKAGIINAVTSPLGFFVLIVLVVEVIFGIIASMSAGSDRTYLIIGMIGIMFLLILIVAGMAIWRPYSLYNPNKLSDKTTKNVAFDFRRSIRDCFKLFKQTLTTSLEYDMKFRLNFLRYDSTKNKLIMYIQDDVYQDKHFAIDIETGAKKGIVVCEAIKKRKFLNINLPPDHYTFYSESPIRETLSSVMASPIRNTEGNIIGVVALDSDKKFSELALSEIKLKETFLNLCNMLEDIIQDAGVKKL